MRILRWGVLAVLATAVVGCGGGLTIKVAVDDRSPEPNDPVTWTVTLHNDSQCDTATDVDPPAGGVVVPSVLIVGFTPGANTGAAPLCRALLSCAGQGCLDIAPDTKGLGGVKELIGETPQSRPRTPATPGCEVVTVPDAAYALVCEFDPIPAGEEATLSFSGFAPTSGSNNPVQFVYAYATARGNDCSPGYEFDAEEWVLGGCLPASPTSSAPNLSGIGLVLLASALAALGVLLLYRRPLT